MQSIGEHRRTLCSFATGTIFGMMIFLTFYLYPVGFRKSWNILSFSNDSQIPELSCPSCKCDKAEQERNYVSVLLNQKIETLAQMKCRLGARTSEGGGYCPIGKSTHFTDIRLANFLKKFLLGKRVASFGEALGQYKNILDPFCDVYDGYDGASFTANKTSGTVKFLDLSVPQYGLPMYDIVISMEVAEHIPRKFEQIYLDNLARYANEGIILSWAVPGQGGFQHVNNRALEYVVKQMTQRGFVRERNVSTHLKNASTLSWLQRNLNYYSRTKLQ